MVEFTAQTVRELKGASLSVLVLLLVSPLPVSQEWLERNSGYTDKPVSQALAYLKETGRVCKTSAGWMLSEGFQMALPASRNYSDSNVFLQDSVLEFSETTDNNNNKSRKYSDSEIWEELAKSSVVKNERTQALVSMPHMTAEYVRAKREEFKARGQGGYQWAGLFIKTLESNVPVEVTEEVDNASSARRYSSSSFGEYLGDEEDREVLKLEREQRQQSIDARRAELKALRCDPGISTADMNRISRELESLR